MAEGTVPLSVTGSHFPGLSNPNLVMSWALSLCSAACLGSLAAGAQCSSSLRMDALIIQREQPIQMSALEGKQEKSSASRTGFHLILYNIPWRHLNMLRVQNSYPSASTEIGSDWAGWSCRLSPLVFTALPRHRERLSLLLQKGHLHTEWRAG